MGYRRFADGRGGRWEIRIESNGEWRFEPVSGTSRPASRGRPPLYAKDPFELSEQELQRILEGARPVGRAGGASPFGGAASGRPKGSPFLDDEEPGSGGEKRSPFLDDR